MGAGVSVSPHFPRSRSSAPEGTRALHQAERNQSLVSRPRISLSRVAQPKHCCLGRSPSRSCLDIATLAPPLSRHLSESPGSAGPPIGKWERHWLAPLPHASSSDCPAITSAASALASVRCLRSGGGLEHSVRFRPGRSRPRIEAHTPRPILTAESACG